MMIKRVISIVFFTMILVACNSEQEQENVSEDAEVEKDEAVETVAEENELVVLPNEKLQKGDTGDSVEILQKSLQEIGYDVDISGTFDDLTVWAITDVQLQQDLIVSGIYTEDVKQILEQMMNEVIAVTVGSQLEKPHYPNQYPETIENPYEILVLVNKDYALPSDFEPYDLVVPDVRFPFEEDDPKKQLRKEAAEALEKLFTAADADGMELFAQSGFRSYDRQEAIFAANVERDGEEHANIYSARAGESEHQTGLVMDVTSQEVGFALVTEFGETKEGKWIEDRAHEFGFIVRYPLGKEDITQYQYEPWHLRYVGEKAATEIAQNNLTLEEYLGVN